MLLVTLVRGSPVEAVGGHVSDVVTHLDQQILALVGTVNLLLHKKNCAIV